MTFPWMQSRYTDKAVVCAICGQWISQGEPRKYHVQSKVSAHDACTGAQTMGDHVSGDPSRSFPIPKESPERESREAAIERMHGENVDAARAIAEAIRGLKASMVETNMLISGFVEAYAKREAGK